MGVAVDKLEAARFYRAAADQGDEGARRALAQLTRGPLRDLVAKWRVFPGGARRPNPKSTTPMATRPHPAAPRTWRARLAAKIRRRVLLHRAE